MSFLSLFFFYSYLWTFADTIIYEDLGFSYVILICHFLVDIFFNFHLAFCFLKSLLVIWYNFQNVLSLNIIFSYFKLSDICPNIGESYQCFPLIISISGTELFHSIIKLTSIFFKISFFKKNIYLFIPNAIVFYSVPSNIPWEICMQVRKQQLENWTWHNRLVPNRKRSTSRLYIVTLFI